MSRKTALINVMEAAARKAARLLVRDFGEVENLQVSRKGPADFVSAADRRAERILREELARARPNFGFSLEEGGIIEPRSGTARWIVDPLDGTTNFLHGIPHFAISIGMEQDGVLVAGVVYEPTRDELFWAENGIGAYVNYRRLRVSSRASLHDAVIGTGIPHLGEEVHDEFATELAALMPMVAGVRRMGAASLDLAYVAAGRFDGYWERGLEPWDVAAGIVLVREAGGLVSDFDRGQEMLHCGHIVAANDGLHAPLQTLLQSAARRGQDSRDGN